jgi:hypothetical protein
MLSVLLHMPRGSFIAPRDLGAIGVPFGRPWLPFVHVWCTLHSATTTNPLIVWFPVLGAPDRSVLHVIVGYGRRGH